MTRTPITLALVCVAAVLVLGCADDGAPSTTLSVGAEGGALRAGGATVTVPAGALSESTDLTLSRLSQRDVTELAADVQFTGMPFELAPLATAFEESVTVNLPYSGGDEDRPPRGRSSRARPSLTASRRSAWARVASSSWCARSRHSSPRCPRRPPSPW